MLQTEDDDYFFRPFCKKKQQNNVFVCYIYEAILLVE